MPDYTPKPHPPTSEQVIQRSPSQKCAVKNETYFPLPWTVTIEVRDLSATAALDALKEQFEMAVTQLLGLISRDQQKSAEASDG